MNYWLMKSEPSTFSIDDLARAPNQTQFWDGVRNYQARNMMRDEMRVGDRAFFYHSSCPMPSIMGVVEIVSAAYPDPTQFDPQSPYFDPKSSHENPRWQGVEVRLVEQLTHPIPLERLRKNPALENMIILRKGNRLSITPVTAQEWKAIL